MKDFIVDAASSLVASSFMGSRWRRGGAIVALTVALGAISSTAIASSQVSGSAESVTVDVQNSSIKEVLAALGQKFGLQVQSSANLDRQISGAYRGSLRRVVARLLEGYNFIIVTNEGKVQVSVLGTQNGAIITGARLQSGANAPGTPVVTPGTGASPGNSSTNPAAASPASPSTPTPAAASSRVAAQATPGTSKPASPAATSSEPPLVLKVAEGGPAPTLGAATSSGPVPKPATSEMPKPTASTAMPTLTPAPATGGAVLPMPTGSKPFPGVGGPQNKTPAAASASNPAPAGSTAPAAAAPAQPATK